MTNNFLIPKEEFLNIRFDERITRYGHEDTLFGLELERRGIRILHLDNPLEHLGLEPAVVFLDKTQQAIENLHFLWKNNLLIKSRLLDTALRLKQKGTLRFVYPVLRLIEPLIRKNLLSARPNLVLFDFFKLGRLLKLMR